MYDATEWRRSKRMLYREAEERLLLVRKLDLDQLTQWGQRVATCKTRQKNHWTAVKSIFDRSLKGTLKFSKDQTEENSSITDYRDATGPIKVTCRLITAFFFVSGQTAGKQAAEYSVALSTTKAEHMALFAGCQKAMWLRARDLQSSLVSSTKLSYVAIM